jgi:MarR family transcriptional regulator, lower aerobic nicotinate degradation pathway regulator
MGSRSGARTSRVPAHGELTAVDGLAQLAFLVHGILERRAAEYDLSITQTRLLGVLRDRQPTMNELAKLLALDKSSVTGLVDRAESRRLVVRVPSATDGRATLVRLSEEGRSLVTKASERFEAEVSATLGLLSASDRRSLSRLINRLLVAHAAEQGVDLFRTADAGAQTGQPPDGS